MSDNFKIHNFIDAKSGISKIRVEIGIETVEQELITAFWGGWNDDVGCKVGEVFNAFSHDFFESYPRFESKLKIALEEKETDLEIMSSTARSKLNEFCEKIKTYDVDPSLYK